MNELKIIVKLGNCKTTVCNCGFKEIFVSSKTTVTNGGSLHLKSMWMLTCIKKTT